MTLQCDETRETEQDGKSHKEGKILLAYTITRQQNENDRLRFRYRRLQTTFSITKILTTRYKRTKNKTKRNTETNKEENLGRSELKNLCEQLIEPSHSQSATTHTEKSKLKFFSHEFQAVVIGLCFQVCSLLFYATTPHSFHGPVFVVCAIVYDMHVGVYHHYTMHECQCHCYIDFSF